MYAFLSDSYLTSGEENYLDTISVLVSDIRRP